MTVESKALAPNDKRFMISFSFPMLWGEPRPPHLLRIWPQTNFKYWQSKNKRLWDSLPSWQSTQLSSAEILHCKILSVLSIDPTVAYQPFNEIPPGNMAFEPKCQPTEGSNSLMARQADFAEKSPERSYRPNDHILSLLHRNKSSRRSLQNFLSDRSSYSRPENPPFSTTVHTLAWRFLPIFQQTAFKYLRRNETYVLLHPNSICS